MVVVEITKIQHRGSLGELVAIVELNRFTKVPVNCENPVLGIVKEYTDSHIINNSESFGAMHVGYYYLLTKEELEAICNK